MECPECGAELLYHDYFGQGNLSAQEKYGYGFTKKGDIYQCPNHEGFETEEDFEAYLNFANPEDPWRMFHDCGWDKWEDGFCESSSHNGHYYTYENDNTLHEGYPC